MKGKEPTGLAHSIKNSPLASIFIGHGVRRRAEELFIHNKQMDPDLRSVAISGDWLFRMSIFSDTRTFSVVEAARRRGELKPRGNIFSANMEYRIRPRRRERRFVKKKKHSTTMTRQFATTDVAWFCLQAARSKRLDDWRMFVGAITTFC